jgi:hypothetical protein
VTVMVLVAAADSLEVTPLEAARLDDVVVFEVVETGAARRARACADGAVRVDDDGVSQSLSLSLSLSWSCLSAATEDSALDVVRLPIEAVPSGPQCTNDRTRHSAQLKPMSSNETVPLLCTETRESVATEAPAWICGLMLGPVSCQLGKAPSSLTRACGRRQDRSGVDFASRPVRGAEPRSLPVQI